MRIESSFDKCSICLKTVPLTWEHIIPESLGSTLESNIQCKSCNDNLGSKLISKAKTNYPIRLAISSLKKDLPSLYASIEEGQEYTGISSEGISATLKYKGGKMITKTHQKNGRIIYDRSITQKHIVSILRKDNKSEKKIENALKIFNDAPIDVPVQIADNYYALKNVYRDIFQKPADVDMDKRMIILLAYNYLCLVLGDTVYHDYFNSIRNFILSGETEKDFIIHQYYYTEDYKPYHQIYYNANDESIQITIIMFGSIVYTVDLIGITTEKEFNKLYIEDLKKNRILFALTSEDSSKGEYYSNK